MSHYKKMPPNILLITVDQMRFDHLGLAGVRGIETPNLDRLGREGVHFQRAYTPSPTCTPARVSLLTGCYPSRHGAYSIGVTPDPFPSPTLPSLLSAKGYRTALFGKSHFVSREDEDRHMSGREDPPSDFFREFDGPYCGFDFLRACSHHTINGVPKGHYRAWLEDHGVDFHKWFPDEAGSHNHGATGRWNIPEKYHDTTWITDEAIRHLAEHPSDKPWFGWVSYNDPHEPFVCPEPWYSAVKESEMELLEGYRKGEFSDKPPFYQAVFDSDEPLDGWPADWRDEFGHTVPCAYNRGDLQGREREAWRATLGMVAMIDHHVGRLLGSLESAGRLENTVVVFTSDHGELHGHHGLWHKGLFAYEDVQRVPLLIHAQGRSNFSGASNALVNLVDLPVTFLTLADVPLPQGIQGASLTPILSGSATAVREATIVELQATRKVYQQTLITDRHKLVVYRDEEYGELYDLENDPDQYHNLWSNPRFLNIKTDLLHLFVKTRMREEGYFHPRRHYA